MADKHLDDTSKSTFEAVSVQESLVCIILIVYGYENNLMVDYQGLVRTIQR